MSDVGEVRGAKRGSRKRTGEWGPWLKVMDKDVWEVVLLLLLLLLLLDVMTYGGSRHHQPPATNTAAPSSPPHHNLVNHSLTHSRAVLPSLHHPLTAPASSSCSPLLFPHMSLRTRLPHLSSPASPSRHHSPLLSTPFLFLLPPLSLLLLSSSPLRPCPWPPSLPPSSFPTLSPLLCLSSPSTPSTPAPLPFQLLFSSSTPPLPSLLALLRLSSLYTLSSVSSSLALHSQPLDPQQCAPSESTHAVSLCSSSCCGTATARPVEGGDVVAWWYIGVG